MNDLNSREYYLGRERQERRLADDATDATIAAIHRDMAERYRELAVEATGNETQHRPRLRICA